jgi:transcriptional regulator with XRE-family HTH domain
MIIEGAMPKKSKIPSEQDLKNKALQEEVGRRVREAREKAGLSQRDVAEKSRITQGYIYMLEGGGQNPTIVTLHLLAQVIGVDMRDLLPEDPKGMPSMATLERVARAADRAADFYRDHADQEEEIRQGLEHLAAIRQQMQSLIDMVQNEAGQGAEAAPAEEE